MVREGMRERGYKGMRREKGGREMRQSEWGKEVVVKGWERSYRGWGMEGVRKALWNRVCKSVGGGGVCRG